ncbi:hypothetical protein [Halomonas cerina]|uniref:Uncharacterized protein n=1 Tax=Halomonas cerina TaxID=447424 RepID=A0A839V691_9GAMM|nr:hypothetical protein [Halomonas cerina]MBB3189315.1 hypothetical protein [Halomonas cerina]
MAVEFGKIKDDFIELEAFVLNDLEIITNSTKGGNYAAALLITAACEALGTLRYGRKDGGQEFFENYLLPEPWRAVSKSIYDALRNGLAHSFSTKAVVNASEKPIELGVSWSKEKHLSYDSGCSVLFLNIQQLANDLRSAFDRYQSELQQRPELRDTFYRWREKQRIYQVQNKNEKGKWNALLKQTAT